MRRLLLIILPALLSLTMHGHTIKAIDLKSEYQANPIGIDYAPQLSWRLTGSDYGILQTHYRVLVASSEEILSQDKGDIWDSGKVSSKESSSISTSHLTLESRQRYFWKVKVWQYENESEWSDSSWWEMGLTRQTDWQGGWIGYAPGMSGRVLYFKGLYWSETGKTIARARAYVAGIGFHTFYVNGEKVSDAVLAPAQSTYSKRIYYETYDLDKLIRPGANSFVIPVAPGWFGAQRLRIQVEITYTDGTFILLNTDNFRHVTTGPIVQASVFDGETYDAREARESIWRPDTPVGLIDKEWAWAHNTDDPTGELHSERVEPIRVVETVKPAMVARPLDGIYVFDAGRNLAGWVSLRVNCERGVTIRLLFSETLREDGTVNQDNLRNAKACDSYTCSGSGEERWEPSFTYHGFRYFQVEGLPYEPSAEDFEVKVIRTDVHTTGGFSCSDELATSIHMMAVNTEASNLHSVPTDCPQRDERMGWLNDLTVSHEIAMFNFDMARFFPKFAQDITDTQDDKGRITCVAPFRFGMRPADPVCASYLLLPAMAYVLYGNRQAIEDQFEGMKAWTDYLRSRTVDGLVDYSYYGDWCPPREFLANPGTGVSRDTPGLMISTGYLYYCEKLIADMANVLGRTDMAEEYREYASQTRLAFNRAYWNEEKGGYASNNQASNAFAVYLGLADDRQAALAMENIVTDIRKRGWHLTTGNLCTKYILDVLADGGYVDDAWELVTQTTYPSWGYMLSKGATTVWERWEYLTGDAMNSHNHPMLATVDAWFYRHILGINPSFDNPGFCRFSLKPCIPKSLEWADGSLDTVKGTIRSSWKKKGHNLIWSVDIPAGTIADLSIPSANGRFVLCNGKRVKTAGSNGRAFLSLESGHYEIKSRI